jgi:hypothetical protein
VDGKQENCIQKLSFTASSGFNLFENLMHFLDDEDLAVVISPSSAYMDET